MYKIVIRRKLTRNGLNGGNFRAKFIDDLVTLEPRIETQPLLAFMDQAESREMSRTGRVLMCTLNCIACIVQGEAAAIVQKGRKASKSSRRSSATA